MKVYISGAITNDPYYKEHFEKVEEELLAGGLDVINPAKKGPGYTYKEYMDMSLKELMQCDTIMMLKGYEYSKGALLELHYAQCVGMNIFFENNYFL